MRVYLLLDRSGSMASQWSDTIGAINTYVKELPKDTNVYIAAFDSDYNSSISYDVLRNTTSQGFTQINESELQPRGGTPLLDAMGRMLDKAFEENPEKAYVVVMTDGHENTSRQFSKQTIAEKLARAEDRKWEVVFMGANFDSVTDQAKMVGLSVGKAYSVSTQNLANEMKWMASATTAYATTGARTVFTDEDRMRAKK
jgi:uncharacterized protein with von Willebrand factor type A (vWA) domain